MTAVTERALYPISKATELLGLSRSVAYEQIRAGRLHTVTVGRRRYVTAAGLAQFVELLEREAEGDGDAA